MQLRTTTTALVLALFIASVTAGGALAATAPLHAQQSPTGTPGTETTAGATTTDSSDQSGSSITFDDQESTGETVSIQSVTVPEAGFVAIYDSSRSADDTEQIIGTFYLLGSGTTENFNVPLDTPINQTTSLTAVVHEDTDGDGQFDYTSSNGTEDTPLTSQGDRRIVDIAQINVQDSAGGNASGAETASGDDSTDAGDSGENEATAADENNSGGTADSSGSGPGFGFVVAVGALLAVSLFALKRNYKP